jgi:hypothetical protein
MQQSINQQAQAQQLAQQVNIPSEAPMQQQQSMNSSPQTHPLPGLEAPVAPIGQHPTQMLNAMNVPIPGVRGLTPQEIRNIRNHPSGQMALATDEQIRTFFMRNQQAQMQKEQQMTPQQLRLQQQHNMRRMQIQMHQEMQLRQQNRMDQQNWQQLQQPGQALQNPNISMPATALMPAQIPQQKQYQPGPELPNSNASVGNATRTARPQSAARNQAHDSSPAPPAQYLKRADQPNPEQFAKCRTIQKEEEERGKEPLPNIPMDPERKAVTEELLKEIVLLLNNVGRIVIRWYLVTGDDVRARAFFRAVSVFPGLNF